MDRTATGYSVKRAWLALIPATTALAPAGPGGIGQWLEWGHEGKPLVAPPEVGFGSVGDGETDPPPGDARRSTGLRY